ncbi:Cell wall protein IFF6 [Nocardia seriolae]|uniref:Cell wall protein IFF6 n=2 Tax=Nocardia seriolae TaxID=37332 RepID=A0ABC8AS13_9NOCA|nr:Cell wall protein IFF6 [Nocardia seriolae]
MTVGFGMSIGTVNSVWATSAGDRIRPSVRVRRTAVTFDSAGGPRIGGIPRFAPVVTDFADLTTEPDPVVIGGRIWSPADLVAAVVNGLIESNAPEAPAVTTYPACYSDKHVTRLRRALDWSGAADVTLMPEPVAAVEWLDNEYGISEAGLTLVYDLGGNSLDLAVVRTEADRQERGILGRAERSHEYGGRPLGTLLARYARSIAPGATQPVSAVVPAADTNRLRSWHIRNSLRQVRSCVHRAGLHMEEIDRVLLIGGAARPAEVARVLADLGRPVIMSPDPAHTVAVGAAIAAFRSIDNGSAIARYAPRAAVISGAAVASALAMSAATVLGGLVAGPPNLKAAPEPADPPAGATALGTGDVIVLEDAAAPPGRGSHAIATVAAVRAYAPIAPTVTQTWVKGRPVDTTNAGTHCETRAFTDGAVTYANPAQFTNPLPFQNPALNGWTVGPITGGTLPAVSIPGNTAQPISGTLPGTPLPGTSPGTTLPGTLPGTTQPGSGLPGAGQPAAGQPGMGQPDAGQPGGAQPGAGQPGTGTGDPGTGQPGAAQPGSTDPGGTAGGGQPGSTPADGTPTGATPGISTPGSTTGGTTTGGTPSAGTPGTGSPAGGAGSTPGGTTGNPAGSNTGGSPGASNPGGANPGGSNPGGSNVGGSSPGGSNPGWFQPGWFQPGWFQPGWFEPGWFQPGWFQPRRLEPRWFQPRWFEAGWFQPRRRNRFRRSLSRRLGRKLPGRRDRRYQRWRLQGRRLRTRRNGRWRHERRRSGRRRHERRRNGRRRNGRWRYGRWRRCGWRRQRRWFRWPPLITYDAALLGGPCGPGAVTSDR